MNEPNLIIAMLKMGAVFIALAGVLVFLLRLVRRFNFLKARSGHENLIHVIATHHVAPRKLIALIHVCGELLVVGISEHNISFLTRIRNRELIAQILERKSRNGLLTTTRRRTSYPMKNADYEKLTTAAANE
jgi:flagellar biogenesis protein FliO